MIRADGEVPSNCETTIDYDNKNVTFSSPNPKPEPWRSYRSNTLYTTCAFIVWAFESILILSIIQTWDQKGQPLGDGTTAFLGLVILLSIFGWWSAFGWLSIAVHTFSKTARKNFPKTNALLSGLKEEAVDLEMVRDHKMFKGGYIDGNRVIIHDYDIVFFEYTYIGENKITKVETKTVEEKDHEGEHMEFVAILTFEKEPTEGILGWRK